MLEAADDTLGIVEEIEINTTIPRLLNESALMKRLRDIRLRAQLQSIERDQHRAQMARARARRQHRHDSVVEGCKPDTVALSVHQVCERRSQALAHSYFVIPRDPPHRAADVEHHMAVEVRFLLELLDVMAIASGVDLPVDRRQIVAGNVLAVFSELDTESFERAAMKAREEPFDDRTGLQFQVAEARNDRRIEKLAFARAGGHGYIPLFGSGTVSSSRSTMVSELMRSDSA